MIFNLFKSKPTFELIYEMKVNGYLPVLAHPEDIYSWKV